MILGLFKGIHIFSPFSNDRDDLKQRLSALLVDRAMVDPSPMEEEQKLVALMRDGQRNAAELAMQRRNASRSQLDATTTSRNGLMSQCENEARQAELETTYSLRALANTMPAFQSLAGRKSLILFTETMRSDPGAPFFQVCGISVVNRPSLGLTVLPEIEDLTRTANLAGVAFYPVHAAGMTPFGTNDGQHSAVDFQTDIALSTGGYSSLLLKDSLQAFHKAQQDSSCHYVIAFHPSDLRLGRHAVRITVNYKGAKVRHREFFTLQTSKQAADTDMLSVLSNPGLYKKLKVDVHGYSLSATDAKKRQFLLKVGVPISELVLTHVNETGLEGSVLIRGAAIAKNSIQCEFEQTMALRLASDRVNTSELLGIETLCELSPGEHELIIAARDETGGALGAYWGQTVIKSIDERSGPKTLIWADAGPEIWKRDSDAPWPQSRGPRLFVRSSRRLSQHEEGVVTFIACMAKPGRDDKDLGTMSLHLDGPSQLDLSVATAFPEQYGACRMLQAKVAPDSLAPGKYAISPKLPITWQSPSGSETFEIVP